MLKITIEGEAREILELFQGSSGRAPAEKIGGGDKNCGDYP